jgi:hypothetical protein
MIVSMGIAGRLWVVRAARMVFWAVWRFGSEMSRRAMAEEPERAKRVAVASPIPGEVDVCWLFCCVWMVVDRRGWSVWTYLRHLL